jgi:hypothetical protein
MIGKLFIEKESDDQKYVSHLDYYKLNSHISNLKWATYDEMRVHATQSPAVKAAFKKFQEYNIKRDGAKLTFTDIIRIKKLILNPNRKTRLKIIAKQF